MIIFNLHPSLNENSCKKYSVKYAQLEKVNVRFEKAHSGTIFQSYILLDIQLADYLARHHGNTVYVSGEEGFSKTLQQKIIMTKADSPSLYFADLRSFDEIKDRIEDKFHFIFIDSLDTLRIDAQKLKELKALHPSSALITISQSTKDGKMRGSNEILHDSDMAVKVENGIAITTKNRYKEAGSEYRVFPEKKRQIDRLMDLHKGIL